MKEFVDNFFFTIINNSLKGPVSENQKWNAKWRDEITVPPPHLLIVQICIEYYRRKENQK
jgi:hypothetical protein